MNGSVLNMRIGAVVALLGALAAACVSTPPPPLGSVDLSYERGRTPIAAVSINASEPRPFVIDTGASATVIDQAFADTLALRDLDEAVLVHGLAASVSMDQASADTLAFGPVARANPVLLIAPPASRRDDAGAIGIDMLRDYAVEFDAVEGRLTFYRTRSAPAGRSFVHVNLTSHESGLMLAPIAISGVRGVALIDTGLSHSVVNENFAQAVLARRKRDIEIVDVTDTPQTFRTAEFADVRLGDLAMSRVRMHVGNPSIFEHLGMSDGNGVILGADILLTRTLVIDFPAARLSVDLAD